jgi:hypothetical protein
MTADATKTADTTTSYDATTTGTAMREWRVIQTVELPASADAVWDVVGGFFTMHRWHPDIVRTEILPEQTETRAIRRFLSIPGQPATTEELLMMDNDGRHYRYKWHAGPWGERVLDYVAELRVFETDAGRRCVVSWSSTFRYTEDALSQFYWNGFHSLQTMFPPPA